MKERDGYVEIVGERERVEAGGRELGGVKSVHKRKKNKKKKKKQNTMPCLLYMRTLCKTT